MTELNPNIKKFDFFKKKRLVFVFITFILILCVSTFILPELKRYIDEKAKNKFVITGEISTAVIDYISALYMDGYFYYQSGWSGNSRYSPDEIKYDEIKGFKLGEMTLDLRGKKYTGIPPSFSGTINIGAQVYSIKNIKKENAVLVVNKGDKSIFYRRGKAVADQKTPLNLTVSDVFNMMSNSPTVSSVELRDMNDGSWMRTSKKEHLLTLINKELPELKLLNSNELGESQLDNRRQIPGIPVNLIFKDDTALDMLCFLESKCAYVFGGYIKLSSELCKEIQELYELGGQYPRISDLLPYKESDVSYLYFVNNTNGDKILCENPTLPRLELYDIINNYRVEEVKGNFDKRLIMTGTLGKSKVDSITIKFYEDNEKQIITEIKGVYCKPVKGHMKSKELINYLYNYTGLKGI